jgi:hypothetical protein
MARQTKGITTMKFLIPTAALVLFATASANAQQTFSIAVEGGTLELSVNVTQERAIKAPRVTGRLTNKTDIDLVVASFAVALYDAKGRAFANPAQPTWTFSVRDLRKGMAKEIGDPGYGEVMRGAVDGKIARYDATLIRALGLGLEKPVPSADLTFHDEVMKIQFSFEGEGLGFTLSNETDGPLKIDWNQLSYVDSEGTAHKVIHQGVRLIQRDQPMSPTTLPPGAKLKEFVYPADMVKNLGTEWEMPPILSADRVQGTRLSLYMPIDQNGTTKNYNFVFKLLQLTSR